MCIVKRRQGSMVCVLVFVLSMLSTGERVNDTVGGIWARTNTIYARLVNMFCGQVLFEYNKVI